jgi:phosphatidate cytidylyltransferase
MTEPPTEQQPQPTSHGRAGRNLVSAIAIGAVLGIGFVLLPILFAPWLFSFIIAAAMVVAVNELVRALAGRGIDLVIWPLYAGVAAVPLAAYWWGVLPMVATFGVAVLLILGWRLVQGPEGYVKDVAGTLMALCYTGLMGGFAALMLASTQGGLRIITFVVLTICSDIGGYIAGVLAGRHPMAPSISPKKSWEGFAGSLVLQGAAGIALFVVLFDKPWWQGLITGLVLTVTATGGDFVESAIKRDLGVKDMSSLLPGHGGLMDRLDSLLPNAFTSWLLLRAFLGP